MKKYALIVAGGSGQRMGSNTPKQFLLLSGKPVLCHTLDAFHNVSSSIHLIVVLPEPQIETWQALCQKHKFVIPHDIVAGGDTRTKSVKNGLQKINGNGLVAIHDGVRPLISSAIIERSYQVAAEQDAALHLDPKAFGTRAAVHVAEIPCTRSAMAVADTVVAREIARRFGGGDQVVGGDPVFGMG